MVGPKALEFVENLKPYSINLACKEEGAIRLSFNEGAFGPSPKAIEAYNAAAAKLHCYPDIAYCDLRHALAEAHGLEADNIVCGTGSDDLILQIARGYAGQGDEVLYSQYGFGVYPVAARAASATPVAAPEHDLRTDVDAMIAAITPRTKVIFLANPNNPTGSYITATEVERLHAAVPPHVVLALDAAYTEYVTAADYSDGIALARKHPNVVVLRTFSKIFGLGGLRVGWAYGQKNIIDVLGKLRQPFNIAMPAAAAAIAALQDKDFIRRSVAHNAQWRDWLVRELSARNSIKVCPSVCNFVLVDFGSPERAGALLKHLAAQKIQIRPMNGYKLASHVRITIGLEDQMKKLMGAINQFLEQESHAEPVAV